MQREDPYETWFRMFFKFDWWWSDHLVSVLRLCLIPLRRIASVSHSNGLLLFEMSPSR
jgi:hypothetical protein